MKKTILTCLCLVLAVFLALSVSAEEIPEAKDLTAETSFSGTGYKSFGFLKDKDILTYRKSEETASITLKQSAGMGSLYLMFDLEYGEYTIKDNTTGKTFTAGTYNFIHEFIDLEAAFGSTPTSVTITFSNGSVHLSEIYVFSKGTTPDFVQKWEPPLDGKTDILMMPTHGDDDQLYFAGLLPYYAGELDCAVQVAYLTNHRVYTTVRVHEILNGLWATGVENYPIFAYKMDFRIDDLHASYGVYANNGITKADLVGFVVEQFRRFKPQVVVGHDINGEYGHGMHLVYADIIMKAVELSHDPAQYPELAEKYGVWDVPKTYLHLLEEIPIEINYDIPLEHYNGLTAFQVTQKYGFPCHETQQAYSFRSWLNGYKGEITKATQIKLYNPCKFGLYRSTIGADVQKNDFLENITIYAEQERLEQERLEQERLEQERLEQERLEQERLEQERLEQERLEKERLEQERLEQERLEQERLEKERLEQEEQERRMAEAKKRQQITVLVLTVSCFAAVLLAVHLVKKCANNKKSSKEKNKIKK